MEKYYDNLSDEMFNCPTEDDATTIHEIEAEEMLEMELAGGSMFEGCDGGRTACQGRELCEHAHTHSPHATGLPPAPVETIYESWTVAPQRPTRRLRGWATCLGCTVGRTMAVGPGRTAAATPPSTHALEPEDPAGAAACPRPRHGGGHWPTREAGACGDELARRLGQLDRAVQGELRSLLRDRSESTSSASRRREYRLLMLVEVARGGATSAGSPDRQDFGKRRWWEVFQNKRLARTPHVEYRVVLEGCETAATDAGWGVCHRYSQPWKSADEAGLQVGMREKME